MCHAFLLRCDCVSLSCVTVIIFTLLFSCQHCLRHDTWERYDLLIPFSTNQRGSNWIWQIHDKFNFEWDEIYHFKSKALQENNIKGAVLNYIPIRILSIQWNTPHDPLAVCSVCVLTETLVLIHCPGSLITKGEGCIWSAVDFQYQQLLARSEDCTFKDIAYRNRHYHPQTPLRFFGASAITSSR